MTGSSGEILRKVVLCLEKQRKKNEPRQQFKPSAKEIGTNRLRKVRQQTIPGLPPPPPRSRGSILQFDDLSLPQPSVQMLIAFCSEQTQDGCNQSGGARMDDTPPNQL
jgi:hypothetical protein